MVICHCRRVSSAIIEAVIGAGADSVDEVTARCGAGGRCGSCRLSIEDLLATTLAAGSESVQPAA
jgi:bacterioferritin-associated ferredoxin